MYKIIRVKLFCIAYHILSDDQRVSIVEYNQQCTVVFDLSAQQCSADSIIGRWYDYHILFNWFLNWTIFKEEKKFYLIIYSLILFFKESLGLIPFECMCADLYRKLYNFI